MNVGKRIRRMREAQDVSLEELAELANVEADHLGKIEKGESVPPIGVVLKLSRALGSKVGQILHDGGPRSDIFSIVPAGEGEEVDREAGSSGTGQGYSYQSLLNSGIRGQGMEPFLVEFDPSSAATIKPMSHQGEEFLYVLDGTIELEYDQESYTLKKGDSLYIDSSKPHSLKGLGTTSPKVIAVVLGKD